MFCYLFLQDPHKLVFGSELVLKKFDFLVIAFHDLPVLVSLGSELPAATCNLTVEVVLALEAFQKQLLFAVLLMQLIKLHLFFQ